MNVQVIRRYQIIAFYIAIVLLGMNLRPIMAAIGPLLEMMQGRIGISDVEGGMLTTIPVFAMGSIALFGGFIQARFGVREAIIVACLLVAAGNGLRLIWNSPFALLLTAAIGGIGIAVVQALMPTFIKQNRTVDPGRGMALFTTGIMGGAAVASATAAPLANLKSWEFSLAVWIFPALLAGVVWILTTAKLSVDPGKRAYTLPLKSPRSWYLMLFFGIGTAAYTLVLAWLPPFYVDHGWAASSSGFLLGGLTICQVMSGLILSAVISRFPDRRRVLAAILILTCVGLLMLVAAPNLLAIPAIVTIGIAIGSLFPLSLIVSLDHLDDPSAAGSLMGFVQGGGYIIASAMPFLAGKIHSAFESFDVAWVLMVVALVFQLAMVPKLRSGDRLNPATWELERK